jgi:hypothetical protein
MNEKLLQFIWQYALFQTHGLKTSSGESLSILQRGTLNTDAGPDFLNAKIRVDDTVWAGNIELHVYTSDWLKHQHDRDANFQRLILHVVYSNDVNIPQLDFPVLELAPYINHNLLQNYAQLMGNLQPIACSPAIASVSSITLKHWLERLLIEKWQQKFEKWMQHLERNKGNWAQLFYEVFTRNLGAKVNDEVFETLARNTPLQILAKHKDNLAHLEAILFGQAGLIPQEDTHPYYTELKVHYAFFKAKYKLMPINGYQWKFLRMRPANFPTIRIAQLAMLLHKSEQLFSKLLQVKDITEINQYFALPLSPYWQEHYRFGVDSKRSDKPMGAQMQQLIWINTIAPLQMFYAFQNGTPDKMQQAMELLHQCAPEQNSIIATWKNCGIKPVNAAESQGLLYLYHNYCSPKRCLQCNIGLQILKR